MNRDGRAPRRLRRYVAAFELPVATQRLILNLPAVKAQMQADRRLLCVILFNALKHLISQNAFAACASVPPSALSKWRKDYAAFGFEGLLPRRGGPTKKVRSGAVCSLELLLRG